MDRTHADGHIVEQGKRKYTDQVPGGAEGTAVIAEDRNSLQEEVVRLIEAFGITPDRENSGQLAAAFTNALLGIRTANITENRVLAVNSFTRSIYPSGVMASWLSRLAEASENSLGTVITGDRNSNGAQLRSASNRYLPANTTAEHRMLFSENPLGFSYFIPANGGTVQISAQGGRGPGFYFIKAANLASANKRLRMSVSGQGHWGSFKLYHENTELNSNGPTFLPFFNNRIFLANNTTTTLEVHIMNLTTI